MTRTLLTLTLAAQLFFGAPSALQAAPTLRPQQTRLWWSLIDPDLAAHFALLPGREGNAPERIVWDWSWRGFLAALFGIPQEKEAQTHAALA